MIGHWIRSQRPFPAAVGELALCHEASLVVGEAFLRSRIVEQERAGVGHKAPVKTCAPSISAVRVRLALQSDRTL
jgi:hypothetical protein